MYLSIIPLNFPEYTPTLRPGRWRDQISIVDKPDDEIVVGVNIGQ